MAKQEVIPEFPKELVKYIVVIIALAILLIYAAFVKKVDFFSIGLLFAFVLLGAVSRLPQRFNPEMAFGIELVSLVTIVSAIKYGWIAGSVVAVLAIAISAFYTRERPQDVFVMLIGFIGMGYFAPLAYGFFGGLGIAAIALTIGYDLLTSIMYIFMGHSWFGCVRFSVMHVPTNYLILKYLGIRLIGI